MGAGWSAPENAAQVDKVDDVQVDKVDDVQVDKVDNAQVDKVDNAQVDKVDDVQVDETSELQAAVDVDNNDDATMSIEDIVAKFPSLESALLPSVDGDSTLPPSDEPAPSAAPGRGWLPQLVQSSVAKVSSVAGVFVGGILACTPDKAKQMLSSCLLWSVNLALDGASALHADVDAVGDAASGDSRTSLLLGRLIERRSVQEEAARRLTEHNGDAEAASRAAFAYYLGFRSKVETAALKQVPGPAGLIYSFYVHLRFFAVVALLHGYDTAEAQTLSVVTFAALGYEPDGQLATEQQLQKLATDALAARLDPVQQLRAFVVAELVRAASSRLLATEVGRELVPACEVLLLTREIVGALWPSHYQLDKALALFPQRRPPE